jgi:hypothetical protein
MDMKGIYQLELLDAGGRVVFATTMNVLAGQADQVITRGNLAAGQYTLRATNRANNAVETVKILVVQR